MRTLIISLTSLSVLFHGTTLAEAPPADSILMNFKNVHLDTVLNHLSEEAGLIVVKDAEIDGRIDIISRKPVSLKEAIGLLNTLLKEKGYTAVRMGRILKIVKVEDAKKLYIPVNSGGDPDAIEPTDNFITQIISLGFLDAERLKKDISSLLPSYADVAANKDSNSLVITDTAANVKRIAEIIRALDNPLSTVAEIQVFQLKYAEAKNTAKLLNDIFAQEQPTSRTRSSRSSWMRSRFGGEGDRGDSQEEKEGHKPQKLTATADERTNTVVVSARADTLKVVAAIIKELDSIDAYQASVAEVKVFHLIHADATNAAKLINDIFKEEEQRQTSTSSSPFSFWRSRFSGRSRNESSEATAAQGNQKVKASADERTNTLVVTARPDTMKVVEEVVKDLDANPVEEQAVFVYHLKNAEANNVEEILNALFGGRERQPLRETGTSRTSAPGTPRTRRGGYERGRGEAGGGMGFGRGPGGGGGGAGAAGQVQASGASSEDLSGELQVVADEDSNSVIIRTAPKNFDRIRQLLEELDRPVPQVVIRVLIAEVTHDDSLDLGTEISALNLRSSGLGQSAATDLGIPATPDGLTLRVLEQDLTVTMNALREAGKLDVLSRPHILASDNQEATITVGQEVPFIRNSRVTDTGQTINTVEYEDIGIILRVTPHINPDGLVIMDINPEVSTLTGITVPISDNVDAPVFAKRSAKSRVAIRNGQTIVIGGLMEDRKIETIKSVPGLGKIPLLGFFFRRKQENKVKTELLIFLTPHVALQPEDLKGISDEESGRLKVIPDAVNPGTFDEHLKGLQRSK